MVDIDKLFGCTRCGYCCQGTTTVSLDGDDQRRMVDVLGLGDAVVREKYWRTRGNQVQMKTVDGHCIFYRDGCSVHPGRPHRCAQWPLHPSILSDEENFRIIVDSCPGLNKDLTYEQFCAFLRAYLSDQQSDEE